MADIVEGAKGWPLAADAPEDAPRGGRPKRRRGSSLAVRFVDDAPRGGSCLAVELCPIYRVAQRD